MAREARYYFGVSADASLAEIQGVVEHYPVFRIEYAGEPGTRPQEIAPGVYRMETGRGLSEANVYLVRSGPGWVLIDTAWPHRGQLIRSAAESLFGTGACPAAILLTHIHPDHSGSALELARLWNLPVHVHPRELPLAPGGYLPQYGNPLDRWLIAPILRLMPRRKVEASLARNSLEGTAQAFDPAAGVPGLPDWQAVPTPGHTPGHVAFFRSSDRVLITGDAVLTVNLNSVPDLLAGKHRVSGPPYISTWDWPAAKQSVAALARLRPEVLACGHGRPMTGAQAAASLASFSDRFSPSGHRQAVPQPRREGPRVDGTSIGTAGHDQRQCSFSTALLCGCDPGRRGTAVQVEGHIEASTSDRRPSQRVTRLPWRLRNRPLPNDFVRIRSRPAEDLLRPCAPGRAGEGQCRVAAKPLGG